MSRSISIVFPHQLFAESEIVQSEHEVFIIEEHLFFSQYKFHKQKIAFHRASMKYYEAYLIGKGVKVRYINASEKHADIRNLTELLQKNEISEVKVLDPVDFNLEKRLREACTSIVLTVFDSPQFLNTRKDLATFFKPNKSSFFQTTFYKQQRKKLKILIDEDQNPEGGKWTYDSENRKKYPKGKTPPNIYYPKPNDYWNEAVEYTESNFPNSPGTLTNQPIYPITHEEAGEWFTQFLDYRFFDFGVYEDAIVKEQIILNHSLLSPLMNAGLLLPADVVAKSLAYAKSDNIPINSTEGFIRQIIGWREFIRGMYECKGVYSRTKNYWNFSRKIPKSFYDGTTGIEPIDDTIQKVLQTGYCHHIERLMILGNFMLLCEFDPKEVYRWFMELFIDAYDWVMVPNVYGMSQFSDGGTFATKPYISGSNYIKKMSNYANGDWQPVWDGLFWTFIGKHQDFFKSNPRSSMIYHLYKKMDSQKRTVHEQNASNFLSKFDEQKHVD